MIPPGKDRSIFLRHRWLSWLVFGAVFILLVLYRIFTPHWLALDIFILLALIALAYLVYDRWQRLSQERAEIEGKLLQAESQLSLSYQRQESVLHISRLISEAKDESEIVTRVLQYAMDLLSARGASFVPLDEGERPQAALSLGEALAEVDQAWIEHLGSPATRQQCGSCQNYEQLTLTCPPSAGACPLLKLGPQDKSAGIYCLPLRRGEQVFGVLNIYIPGDAPLDRESRAYLHALVEETSLALEAVRMRKRAMTTLRQMQAAREKTDLSSLLSNLLVDLPETLDADLALVTVWDPDKTPALQTIASHPLPENARHLVDGILHSVITSKEPVLLGNVAGDALSSPGVRALMAVPLVAQDQPGLGAILVANLRPKAFNQNQLATLQTIAGQVAQVIQNINLLAQLEYNTIVQERTRLAREIHDGLAQTLGFLKLIVGQMKHSLENGQVETLHQMVDTCFDTLVEAYQDARHAIDGLRILPSEEGLAGWLSQTADDFEEATSIKVSLLEPVSQAELPSEIHVQLIRVVQEALSNIRKHSEAQNVHISCLETHGDLVLEVRDDGLGFSPEDVPGPSQHGLRGMRERAELIGADFQVISLADQGTTVRVILPLQDVEKNRT